MEGLKTAALKRSVDEFKGRRVLVTGHTGFKGSWLSLWLHELGAHVTGYALAPLPGESLFDDLGLSGKIDHHIGDVRDAAHLLSVVEAAAPEIVFHLAAQPLVRRSYADPAETHSTNVQGGVNLLEAVRQTKSIKSLVFITSDKCYENVEWDWGYREIDRLGGKDPYSASKAAIEVIFASYASSFFSKREAFGYATTRAGNVIGGGDWSADRLIPDCIRSLRRDETIILRSPFATRPWQHVLEPLSGYMDLALALLADPKKYSGAWNFGPDGGGFLTVEDVALAVCQDWGSGAVRREIDPNAPHEATLLHLSIDKAVSRLGWHPTYSAREAISETALWYKKKHDGGSATEITSSQIAQFVRRRSGK